MTHRPIRASLLTASLLVCTAGLATAGCDGDSSCKPDEDCAPEAPSDDGAVAASSGSGAGGEGTGGAGGGSPQATIVTVRDGLRVPVADHQLIASAPDGSLTDRATTADDGTATLKIPDGGSVSVVFAQSYVQAGEARVDRRLQTVAFEGAPPPLLRLNVWRTSYPTEPSSSTMTITASYPVKPGASYYQIQSSCFSESTAATSYAEVALGCTPDGLYDLAVIARDASGGILDYALVTDQAFEVGGSVTHSLAWNDLPVASVPVDVTGIAPAASLYVSSAASQQAHATALFAGVWLDLPNPSASFSDDFDHAVGFGNRHCVSASTQDDGPFDAQLARLKSRCGQDADTSPFVWDASRLAAFDVHPPTPDPLTLRWTEGAGRDRGDYVAVEQRWRRDGDAVYWAVYMVPEAGEMTIPELPEDLAEFGVIEGDILERAETQHVDASQVASFTEALSITGIPVFESPELDRVVSSLPLPGP